MKHSYSQMFLDVFNLIISFLFSRWFFMRYLYFYSLGVLGYQFNGTDFWIPLFEILVITLLIFTILRFFYAKKINKNIIYFLYFIYSLLLFYVLFLKSRGLQGYNLNLLSYLYDAFVTSQLTSAFNILLFIPLGALFKFNKTLILKFTVAIFIVEIAQFLLHLGFFDIGDILFNTIGFIIGMTISDSIIGKKIKSIIQ